MNVKKIMGKECNWCSIEQLKFGRCYNTNILTFLSKCLAQQKKIEFNCTLKKIQRSIYFNGGRQE